MVDKKKKRTKKGKKKINVLNDGYVGQREAYEGGAQDVLAKFYSDEINKVRKQIEPRWMDAYTFKTKYQDRLRELIAYKEGTYYEGKNLPSWYPKNHSGDLTFIAEVKAASVTSNSYDLQVRPLSPEDEETVYKMQNVLTTEFKQSGMDHYVKKAIKESRFMPMGILAIHWEPDFIVGGTNNLSKGLLEVEDIDIMKFYWDPKAFDISQCRYTITTQRTTWDMIKSNPALNKNKELIEYMSKKNLTADNNIEEYLAGEWYEDRDYSTNQDDVITLKTMLYIQNPGPAQTVSKILYIGNDIILDHIDLKINVIPIVTFEEFERPDSFLGTSTAERILPNQKAVDIINNRVLANTIYLQNPKHIITKSSGINARAFMKARNTLGTATVTNDRIATQSVYQIPPVPIDPSAIQQAERHRQMMYSTAGVNDAYTGAQKVSGASSGAVAQVNDRSKLLDTSTLPLLKRSLIRTMDIMVQYIKEYYDRRTFRVDVDDPNAMDDYVWYNVQEGEFRDINLQIIPEVEINPELSKTQVFDQLMQMLNAQAALGNGIEMTSAEELIKASLVPDKRFKIARVKEQEEEVKQAKAAQTVQIIMNLMKDPQFAQLPIQELTKQVMMIQEQTRKEMMTPTSQRKNAKTPGMGGSANKKQA